MLGIFGQCGIRLIQHLAKVETTCGKRHDGIGVGSDVVTAPRAERFLLLGAHQGIARFCAKHCIHPFLKSSQDGFRGLLLHRHNSFLYRKSMKNAVRKNLTAFFDFRYHLAKKFYPALSIALVSSVSRMCGGDMPGSNTLGSLSTHASGWSFVSAGFAE